MCSKTLPTLIIKISTWLSIDVTERLEYLTEVQQSFPSIRIVGRLPDLERRGC